MRLGGFLVPFQPLLGALVVRLLDWTCGLYWAVVCFRVLLVFCTIVQLVSQASLSRLFRALGSWLCFRAAKI